jgi:hypothetical protein
VHDAVARTCGDAADCADVKSRRNSVIEVPMASTRLVRTLLLLIALVLGIGSTTSAIACAAMAQTPAMAMMLVDHCGADGGGSPHHAGTAAPCALACPTGCLMAMPIALGANTPTFGTPFATADNSPRLTGVVLGPEPPRPRAPAAT